MTAYEKMMTGNFQEFLTTRLGASTGLSLQSLTDLFRTGPGGGLTVMSDEALRSGKYEPFGGALGKFSKWYRLDKKTDAQHAEYVKEKKAAPGRDSTVLGSAFAMANTLLGTAKPTDLGKVGG